MRPTVLTREELSTQFRPQDNTSLGLHWDNIVVSESPQVSCACCDALESTVAEYRQTVLLLYRRWLAAGEAHRANWQRLGFTAPQIKAMTRTLHDTMLPADGFFNESMAQASDHELAVYVCSFSDMSHTIRLSQHHATSYDWTVAFDPATRLVCRQLLQPFHVAAAKASMRVTRLPMQLIRDEDADDDDQRDAHKAGHPLIHFVGAVAASGLVVGFTYPADQEQPMHVNSAVPRRV